VNPSMFHGFYFLAENKGKQGKVNERKHGECNTNIKIIKKKHEIDLDPNLDLQTLKI